MWLGLLRKAQIVRRMRLPRLLQLATRLQALQPVLADGLQHRQTLLLTALRRLVKELLVQQ